eukprot:jgi/Mesvir1/22640/Mv14075-RA.1
MAGIARGRLTEERRAWRMDRPFGFVALPEKMADGSLNMLCWKCKIPGPKGTPWEGGLYPLTLLFSEDYPSKPPKCSFPEGFFHPNVYPSGKVCLSIVNESEGWKPAITVRQILVGIQELLGTPNNHSPAQEPAYHMLRQDPAAYNRRVKEEAKKYPDMS